MPLTPSHLTLDDALRAAINLLRDSAESRKMPSGVELPEAAADLHAAAADLLEDALRDSRAAVAATRR